MLTSVTPIFFLFQEKAFMEIHVWLAAVMFVSDEMIYFPSRSFHLRAVSPGYFGKDRRFW